MRPLGCRTYLDAKAEGKSSMFEKAEYSETIKEQVRRDPNGMVKARLPEPQWPICNSPGRIRWLTSDVCLTISVIQPLINMLHETGLTSSTSRPRIGHLQPS